MLWWTLVWFQKLLSLIIKRVQSEGGDNWGDALFAYTAPYCPCIKVSCWFWSKDVVIHWVTLKVISYCYNVIILLIHINCLDDNSLFIVENTQMILWFWSRIFERDRICLRLIGRWVEYVCQQISTRGRLMMYYNRRFLRHNSDVISDSSLVIIIVRGFVWNHDSTICAHMEIGYPYITASLSCGRRNFICPLFRA